MKLSEMEKTGGISILFIITRADTLGGAHIHVADMSKWLIEKGHEVMVLLGGEGPYCDYLSKMGVPYRSSSYLCRPISPFKDVRAIAEIRSYIRKIRPDLIALHSAKAGLLGRIAAVHMRVPVVFTAHGWSFTEGVSEYSAILYRFLERMAAPLSDRIITVSEYDRALAVNAGVASSEKLITIHNAMADTFLFADPGYDKGPVRIVMVARLDAPKDHAVLFSALSGLRDYDWILDLVGDGPHEESLRDEVARMGLSDRVNFLGLRTDVAEILSRSHVFVLTSNWEGFPYSILEAMRAGLPVVASAVGGIPEAVRDNETGYLVGRGDAEALRDRLAVLLTKPDERVRLGAEGRKNYEKKFRLEHMAERTLSIYMGLIREYQCASV